MSGLVDKITKAVMGISAIVVFVITFLQVLCRFVLKSPLPWSTDILRLAFTYLVFWGAAWCVREKEHLNASWWNWELTWYCLSFSFLCLYLELNSVRLDGRRRLPICRFQ